MRFGHALAIAPPMQEHPMTEEHLTLSQRMDRQERALGELRQDTAKQFGEMRAHTKTAISTLRDDVHSEFKSVHSKLDDLISAVGAPRQRKLLGR